ncbi:MAG TPA: phytoene/squalene synthase family protein [Actinomycetes bacterium]|nr:phytoene/squalene synthase family protein [Actinomycetes bacterium]
MNSAALDAAGIVEPELRRSYQECQRLNAAHGKTYYLATLLLPAQKRPFVHALYAFARYADEIVDDLDNGLSIDERRRRLTNWGERFLGDLDAGQSDDPVCRAVVHTAATWDIPAGYFVAFLASMQMDLSTYEYRDYPALFEYMYGSAAVIGLEVLPILEPISPAAAGYAIDLGVAFQLANFIRDVGEDLDRGRLYLPLSDLERFDLTRADLERRVVDDRVRALLSFEIARVRRLARASAPGTALLAPESRPCIDAARELYCGIVDAVERIDYQVFDRRATVPIPTRLRVAAPLWLRAVRARPHPKLMRLTNRSRPSLATAEARRPVRTGRPGVPTTPTTPATE